MSRRAPHVVVDRVGRGPAGPGEVVVSLAVLGQGRRFAVATVGAGARQIEIFRLHSCSPPFVTLSLLVPAAAQPTRSPPEWTAARFKPRACKPDTLAVPSSCPDTEPWTGKGPSGLRRWISNAAGTVVEGRPGVRGTGTPGTVSERCSWPECSQLGDVSVLAEQSQAGQEHSGGRG